MFHPVTGGEKPESKTPSGSSALVVPDQGNTIVTESENEGQYPCQVPGCKNMVPVYTSQDCRPCAGVTHVKNPECGNEVSSYSQLVQEAVRDSSVVNTITKDDLDIALDLSAKHVRQQGMIVSVLMIVCSVDTYVLVLMFSTVLIAIFLVQMPARNKEK